jgi:hypothetical protein
LNTFDSYFKLPATTLTVLNERGQPSPLPGVDPTGNGEGEEALDVEYAHAMAPGANLVLIEATSFTPLSILNAISAANHLSPKGAPVVAVSMSLGFQEFTNQANLDATYFSTPGITYFAASGDNGAFFEISASGLITGAEWPASSANVVSVGGTTMTLTGTSRVSETGWSGSGGGPSLLVGPPAYQSTYATAVGNTVLGGISNRGTPDVSYDADPGPGSGVAVFNSFTSYQNVGTGRTTSIVASTPNWTAEGGTSAGTPQWAAIAADVDSIRLAQPNGTSLSGATQFLPALYKIGASSAYASDFYDITTGNNGLGFLPGFSAGLGYDLVTGLGSPNLANLIPALVSVTGSVTSASNTLKLTPGAATPAPTKLVGKPAEIPLMAGEPTASAPSPAPTSTMNLAQPQPTAPPASAGPVAAQAAAVVVVSPSAGTSPHVEPSIVVINPPKLPPQSLLSRAASGALAGSRQRATRQRPAPFAATTLAPGWPGAARSGVSGPETLDPDLDLEVIAAYATALGRVAIPDAAGPGAALEPVDSSPFSDTSVRAPMPPLDPALAGVAVALAGALVLKIDPRADGSRRWRSVLTIGGAENPR